MKKILILMFILVTSRSLPAQNADPSRQIAESTADWQTAAGAKISFDVASIRPSDIVAYRNISMETDDYYVPTGGLFSGDFPLATYILFAYKLNLTPEQKETMLAHLPKWVATQSYAVRARAPGNPTKDQMRLMMQSLLADRFKLTLHFDQRNVPAFALVLANPPKLGPKLRPHADGPSCNTPISSSGSAPSAATGIDAGGSVEFPFVCGRTNLLPEPGNMILWGSRDVSIARLGAWLPTVPPSRLGRPVVDQTGLSGKFDFTLQWRWIPHSDAGSDAQPDSQGPTLEEALKEQLGLRLKSTSAIVPVLIIDHVEEPSAN